MAAADAFKFGKLSAGERFKQFTILYPLAGGTLSSVYAARDAGGKHVALKIPNERAVSVGRRLRKFRSNKTEGEIALSLEHPHIVRTLQAGRISSGVDYLVMEFMPGNILSAVLPQLHKTFRANPIRLFLQMAEALAYIHGKGYIHRDFHPKNIFALADGDFKLFDFGLTIEIEKAKRYRGNRTGTLSYLAPELIRRLTTDERTDVYAFGVMMYELFTLERPYGAGTSLAKMMRLLNSEPTNPRTYYPELPPVLEAIIMKALRPDPARRYASMREIIDDLKGAQRALDLDYEERIAIGESRRR